MVSGASAVAHADAHVIAIAVASADATAAVTLIIFAASAHAPANANAAAHAAVFDTGKCLTQEEKMSRGTHSLHWDAAEDAMLRLRFDAGDDDLEIAEKLSGAHRLRSEESVMYRRHRLGLRRDRDTDFIGGDLKFKQAMIAAVKRGEEKCFFGIRKDLTPFPPSVKRYECHIEVRGGSPAGSCVEG